MEVVRNKEVIYEFGRFVLDPAERALYADGRREHLPAKEFDTLMLLVENNGRALSKEEMISAIWQDAFVEEGNLAKQISRLRKLLNTDGLEYIETIPKHGYRFNGEVRLVERPSTNETVIERRTVKRISVSMTEGYDAVALPLPSGPASSRKWSIYGGLGVGLLVLAALLTYLLWPRTVESPTRNPTVGSVAVLPFRAADTETGDASFRIGLTDALTTKLGSLQTIIVRPTNAVRSFDGHDPATAGRTLQVDAILDGTIQRDGDRVRVSVQLISVTDGGLIWGSRYDEPYTDVFRMQDAIAEQVVSALEVQLSGDEKRLLAKRYTTVPEAHYAYVKGRIAWNKRTADHFREAIAHFEEAIAKDPNYALAYAGLADAYSLLGDYRGAPPNEAYARAKQAAERALVLDPDLAEAQTALAYVRMYHLWDWEGAENGYRRAIALNPNYATAHQWYSEYLSAMGRFDEALVEIRRAKEIDPLSSIINAGEVWILYHARRYDEAIEHGRRLAEMNPQFAEVHEYLKRSYDQKGMYREAIASRQARRKLAGLDPAMTPAIKRASEATDHATYWKARLDQELADSQAEPPSTFDLAEIYAQLGDKDKAFEWLEKAFAEKTYTMIYLRVAPNLDPLRGDPKFADLLKRVGLNA